MQNIINALVINKSKKANWNRSVLLSLIRQMQIMWTYWQNIKWTTDLFIHSSLYSDLFIIYWHLYHKSELINHSFHICVFILLLLKPMILVNYFSIKGEII